MTERDAEAICVAVYLTVLHFALGVIYWRAFDTADAVRAAAKAYVAAQAAQTAHESPTAAKPPAGR